MTEQQQNPFIEFLQLYGVPAGEEGQPIAGAVFGGARPPAPDSP